MVISHQGRLDGNIYVMCMNVNMNEVCRWKIKIHSFYSPSRPVQYHLTLFKLKSRAEVTSAALPNLTWIISWPLQILESSLCNWGLDILVFFSSPGMLMAGHFSLWWQHTKNLVAVPEPAWTSLAGVILQLTLTGSIAQHEHSTRANPAPNPVFAFDLLALCVAVCACAHTYTQTHAQHARCWKG